MDTAENPHEAKVVSDPDSVPWPHPIVKPEAEWTEFDRDYIDFMRTAYAEGYGPRHNTSETLAEAGSPSARSACLIFRGRLNGWEPWLAEGGLAVPIGPRYGLPETACIMVRLPFRSVAQLALGWLRGGTLDQLLAEFEFTPPRYIGRQDDRPAPDSPPCRR